MPPNFAASSVKNTKCDAPASRHWCTSNASSIALGTVDTPGACLELCHRYDLAETIFKKGCCQWNPPLTTFTASASSGSTSESRLVDGNRDSGKYFHSGWNVKNPWIQVDLGKSVSVTEVRIYHRLTVGRDKMAYHEIWIGDDPTTPQMMCWNGTYDGSAPWGKSLTWELPCVGAGQYVRITLPGETRTMMAFEVEVTAKLPGPCSLLPAGVGTAAQDGANQWSGACADVDEASARQALLNNAPKVIEDLSLLLADGRMSKHTKGLLETGYVNTVNKASFTTPVGKIATDALKVVQEIAAAVPEFHTTNLNIDAGARVWPPPQEPHGHKFKAIVVVNLHGGADSYNFLVPYSNCVSVDLYEEYKKVRGNVALSKSELLQIEVPSGSQPCSTFALNPKFANTHALFSAGEAAWVSNIGTMIEPMTVAEYKAKSRRTPAGLFGHAAQRLQVQTSHAQNPNAKGVFGRAVSSLMHQVSPYKSEVFDVGGGAKILSGSPLTPIKVGSGVTRWSRAGSSLQQYFDNITDMTSHSIFAETYAESVGSSLRQVDELADELADATVTTSFPSSGLGNQLKMASRLVKVSLKQKTERVVFMSGIYGFDTHASAENSKGPILPQKLQEFDDALKSFRAEMKVQGVWDDVVIMTVSDFGRTLSSNSAAGTDHGWGGNNVIVGGGLNGGQIFGKYPPRLALDEGQDLGRGRLLPTMSWEGLWHPVLEWFGVEEEDMPAVLPNLANFAAEQVIPKQMLFK
jgi:cullin-associated NEDD8-dissociated protein 1